MTSSALHFGLSLRLLEVIFPLLRSFSGTEKNKESYQSDVVTDVAEWPLQSQSQRCGAIMAPAKLSKHWSVKSRNLKSFFKENQVYPQIFLLHGGWSKTTPNLVAKASMAVQKDIHWKILAWPPLQIVALNIYFCCAKFGW